MMKLYPLFVVLVCTMLFCSYYRFAICTENRLMGPVLRAAHDKLAPCDGKYNCAITQVVAGQIPNVQPIVYTGSRAAAMARLSNLLKALKGYIVTQAEDYVHATFASTFFGFIDDVECYAPAGEYVIHMRSAARTGIFDFGVNKRRLAHIKQQFEETP